MDKWLVYPVGNTPASRYAAEYISESGIPLTDHPTPEVTHLLLDVPSFGTGGNLRGGGDVEKILETLPQYITVIGGNLDHPALQGYHTLDLLQNADYVAENAAITADCALQIAASLLTTTLHRCPTLIIGWGRIGKSLGQTLKAIGTDVTVAARKETDRAILRALGYHAADPAHLNDILPRFRLIFNTAPEMVLHQKQLSQCRNCLKIDLASRRGLEGEDVLCARGLPGIHAPESSGQLIAQTVLRLMKEDT